jgi:ethanolamine utilization protein EutN
MQFARVIGTLVPCTVCEGLAGVPMLWVQPLDQRLAPAGRPLVCADGTRMAGPGELVYFVASREAALVLDPWFVPVDHAIVGIVDTHALDEDAAEAGPRRGEPAPVAAPPPPPGRPGRGGRR